MGPNIKTRIAGQKPPVFSDKSAEFIHGEFGTLVTPRIRFAPRSMKNVEHEDRLGQTRYQGFKYRGITSGYAASNALLLKRKDRCKRVFNPFVFDEVRELVHCFLAILSRIELAPDHDFHGQLEKPQFSAISAHFQSPRNSEAAAHGDALYAPKKDCL